MAVLTLTTDFGTSDYYVAAFKGAVLSELADVDIIDVSHFISSFDVNGAAFILKNAWSSFPKGTLHVIRVGEFSTRKNRYVAARFAGHFFIAPDNGLLSLAVEGKLDQVIAVDYPQQVHQFNDFLAKIIAHVLKTGELEDIGQPLVNMEERLVLQPVIMENVIRGTVVHVDHYGNVFTNIDKHTYDNHIHKRRFEVAFRTDRFTRISEKYNDVVPGEKVCFFNGAGLLQISINQGNASQLLGLRINDVVQIDLL